MSSSVSQIEYWREPNKIGNKNDTNNVNNASEGGAGATYLSYDMFMALSILGGGLALDHLYLRSPLTFLAKLIVNVLTFGTWWLYDATQAVFNRDVVKVFGLGVPGLGPKGIAAGVLGSDIPDKKHMAFFIYSLALMLGGMFGLDSFILGDKISGIIRLVCLITIILAPIAIFWWLLNLGKFFFQTKDVTSLYWEYFGAPAPAEYGMTVGEKLSTRFPFLQKLFGPIARVKNAIVTTAEATLIDPVETVKSVIAGPISTAIEPVLTVAAPFKETLNTGLSVVQSGLSTAQDGIALGKNALNTGSDIASKTLNVVGQTADAATKAFTLAPSAAALSTGLTTAAAQTALTVLQKGGASDSNILPYALMGTLAIIAVSGLILTYRRARQNVSPRNDDSPPNPETSIARVL